MSVSNTPRSYGTVTKTFHWVTAGLILVIAPLGIIAERLPYATDAELALKAQLFSAHKTLGGDRLCGGAGANPLGADADQAR